MTHTIRVASAQYPIDALTTFAAFEEKLTRWVDTAAKEQATLLVFPEYGAMELTRIAGRLAAASLPQSLEALRFYLDDYRTLYERLAKTFGVYILSGSAPVFIADGRYVNRARLFSPNGASGYQQKHIMTRFEAEEWGISPSTGLCIFDIGAAKVGIAICYDVEFPLLVHAIAEAGADIVLVPSCTDTLAGYNRVRIACAARALENQVYLVQSCTVGDARWSAAIDTNVGAAGFFAPPDMNLSETGVIAQGDLNSPGWVYADLDLGKLRAVRQSGEVLNAKNWAQQARLPKSHEVTPVDLT